MIQRKLKLAKMYCRRRTTGYTLLDCKTKHGNYKFQNNITYGTIQRKYEYINNITKKSQNINQKEKVWEDILISDWYQQMAQR
jgi:hypothetical protein